MSTFQFSASLPFDDSWDVIVIGGGPTGCTAAASAAREGARTLLIESSGLLGGSGTGALVPAWCPFSDKEQVIYKGLAETILKRCKSFQPHVPEAQVDWVPIDPERLKWIYDDVVTSSGAKILFHTALSAVERDDDGNLTNILITNKSGLSALRAKVYIDCSGDADLSAWSGAEFFKGDDTGDLMPATHCFLITNVDEYAFNTNYKGGGSFHAGNTQSPIYKILDSGKYPLIPDGHFCCNLVGPKTVGFNSGHMWNVDNTDPESISQALVHGRKMARQYCDALREFCPDAFGNAFLVSTGSTVGIRETRRIVGDYILTLDDYLARRTFSDEICRNSYFIDIHHALKDVEEHNKTRTEGLQCTVHYNPGESHGIPYRCLTPKGLRNVLVAGRSISCERIVQGSVRVMPVCLAMGEAAGMAAVHAINNHDTDVHAVDTEFLRNRLREEGGYLPENGPETVMVDAGVNGHAVLA